MDSSHGIVVNREQASRILTRTRRQPARGTINALAEHMNNQLSRIDRFSLAMQCRILAAVDPSERSGWLMRAQCFENGYADEYSTALEHVYEEISPQMCRFAKDVLDMYSSMQASFRQVKGGIEGLNESDLDFPGFDGNAGDGLLGYVSFLRDQGRWSHLQASSKDLNSHMSINDHYEIMLRRLKDCSGRPNKLTPKEILWVLRGVGEASA